MKSATNRIRPVLSNLHFLAKSFTANTNSNQISQHFCWHHSISTFTSCARTSKPSTEIKNSLSVRLKGMLCAQNLLTRNCESFLRTTNSFYQVHLFYGTSSKDEVKEMTDEEKLLYRIIKSEKDSFPVDESSNVEQSEGQGDGTTRKLIPKKGKKKKTEKFKEKMSENLNFPNVTVYVVGKLNLRSLHKTFENDESFNICQLPPEFQKEALMIRSKNKKQDGTYTDAFFFKSYGVACWAMNQHQGEDLVVRAMKSEHGTIHENLFKGFQDVLDNREVFRTVRSEDVKRLKDKIQVPSVTDTSLLDDKASLDLSLKKYAFSKALLQSVMLGLFEEKLDDFIENRGLRQRTEELKLGIGSAMNSKNVYTGFGEISYIRYHINLSDLFDEDPDEYWEYDDLDNLYKDMVFYLSIPKRIRELNKNLDYCQDLIKLFNDRLTDKHHVMLERIIIVLIFIEILIELVRIAVPYIMPSLLCFLGVAADGTSQGHVTVDRDAS